TARRNATRSGARATPENQRRVAMPRFINGVYRLSLDRWRAHSRAVVGDLRRDARKGLAEGDLLGEHGGGDAKRILARRDVGPGTGTGTGPGEVPHNRAQEGRGVGILVEIPRAAVNGDQVGTDEMTETRRPPNQGLRVPIEPRIGQGRVERRHPRLEGFTTFAADPITQFVDTGPGFGQHRYLARHA